MPEGETASAKALGQDHAYVFKNNKVFGGEAGKGRKGGQRGAGAGPSPTMQGEDLSSYCG